MSFFNFNYLKKDSDGDMVPNLPKIITHAILGIITFTLVMGVVFGSWFIVNPGERGIVLRLGKINRVADRGFYFKIPYIESVEVMDVQTHKLEVQALAYSKDIQTVDSKIALNYRVEPSSISRIYEEVRKEYETRIIDPAIQESVKAATAHFTAQDLIEQRPKVKAEIHDSLKERLLPRGIVVEEFSIVNFDFSDIYEQAVEAKQKAQQDALKAENDLKRVQFESEQRVTQAKAEAEAIRIQAQAITQQGGRDYVSLKWIEAWKEGGAKVPEIITGEGGANFLYNLR